MLNIIYNKRHNHVTIEGHAGYAPKGQDIICAGVSAIAMTLGENVRWMDEKGYLQSMHVDLSDGVGTISCTPKSRYTDSIRLVFDSICAGFEIISRDAPEYVHFEVHG